MVKFLTTSEIHANLETIIRKARQKLILMTPYLKFPQILYERLLKAGEQVKEFIIIYGKDEIEEEQWEKIKQLPNVQIFYYQNLHAKCYYNESMMIIASLNLHEFSLHNNREMGILVTRDIKGDNTIYDEAEEETLEIINNSKVKEVKSEKAKAVKEKIPSKIKKLPDQEYGYCVRCYDEIKLNPKKPYCYDCFSVWEQYENPEYPEIYCHRCGEYNKSTMNKPLCYSCYKKI